MPPANYYETGPVNPASKTAKAVLALVAEYAKYAKHAAPCPNCYGDGHTSERYYEGCDETLCTACYAEHNDEAPCHWRDNGQGQAQGPTTSDGGNHCDCHNSYRVRLEQLAKWLDEASWDALERAERHPALAGYHRGRNTALLAAKLAIDSLIWQIEKGDTNAD